MVHKTIDHVKSQNKTGDLKHAFGTLQQFLLSV